MTAASPSERSAKNKSWKKAKTPNGFELGDKESRFRRLAGKFRGEQRKVEWNFILSTFAIDSGLRL